jgi:acyl-CoA hydrolase
MTESTTQPVTGLDAEPTGDLTIRTVAMPADTNANGDIFGGWLLSQMDLGGGIFAAKVAKTRTVTVAIEAMTFRKAVMSAMSCPCMRNWCGWAARHLPCISRPGCFAATKTPRSW